MEVTKPIDGRGGKREGAGRPKRVDEKKANEIMKRALRELYSKESDDDAKVAFVKDLLESQRGQIFIAEHVFGKAPQEVVQTNLNIDEKEFSKEQINDIVKAYKLMY